MKLASLKTLMIALLIISGGLPVFGQHPAIEMLGIGGGKCETLVNWAQPIQLEFAQGKYYSRDVFAKTVTLFTSEYFEPHFGKSYGELSKGERKKYLKSFTACFRNRKYINQVNTIPELRNLVQAFNEIPGQWSEVNIIQALGEYEKQAAQYESISTYLNGDPAMITQSKLNEYRRIVPDMSRSRYVQSPVFKYLWPSKLVELSDLISQKESVAKENEYRLYADQLLAKPNNIQTLRELANFENSGQGQGVNPKLQQALRAKMSEKQGAILNELMQLEDGKLRGITGGMQGLLEVNNGLGTFQSQYGSYRNAPVVERVFNTYLQKHESLLIENKSLISKQIDGATSPEELNLINGRYFSVHNHQSLAQLQLQTQIKNKQQAFQAAATQKARLESEEAAKEFKRKLTATTETGEPTEFQMKVAYEFQVNAKNQEYDRAMTQLEQAGGGAMKDATALMRLIVPKTETTLNSFEKIACEKAQGKPGYVCDYAAQKSVNASYVGTIQGENNVNSARFVRKSNGVWQLVEYLNN